MAPDLTIQTDGRVILAEGAEHITARIIVQPRMTWVANNGTQPFTIDPRGIHQRPEHVAFIAIQPCDAFALCRIDD